MKAQFSLSDIENIKRELAAQLPRVKSSHRVEAMARGLGWNTNAALRADLAVRERERLVDDRSFVQYLGEHGFTATFGSLGEAVVRCKFFAERGAISAVMARYPTLSRFGFGLPNFGEKKSTEERAAELNTQREEMLSAYAVDEFLMARHFLSQFGQRSTINKVSSSYGLKHQAEEQSRNYVSNGMLIAAAVHLGFKLQQVGPNAYFNIRTKPGR